MSKRTPSGFIENFFTSLTICSITLVILLCMKLEINIGEAVAFVLLGSFLYALAETKLSNRKK